MGWDWPKNKEIKKNLFRSVPTKPELENTKKKKQENSKNLKSIILASLQAETGRDRLKNRQKKNISFQSVPTRHKEIKKKK